jgi:hypothetical protein
MKNLIFLFIFALMASTVVGQNRIITPPPSSASSKSEKAKKTQKKDTRKTSITSDSDIILPKKIIDLVDHSEKVKSNAKCVTASNSGWGTYMSVVSDSTPLYYKSEVTGKKERLRIKGVVMVFSKTPYNVDDHFQLTSEVLEALKKFDNSNGSLRRTQGEVVVKMIGVDNQMKDWRINQDVLMKRDFSARQIITNAGLDAPTDMLFCFRYKTQNQFRRFIIVAKIDSNDVTISRDTLGNLLLEQAFLLYANTLNQSLNSFGTKREVTREIEKSDSVDGGNVGEKPTVEEKGEIKMTLSVGGNVQDYFYSVFAENQGDQVIIAARGSLIGVGTGAAISYGTPTWGVGVRATYGIVNSASSSLFRRGSSITLGGELMYRGFTVGAGIQKFSTDVNYQASEVEAGYLHEGYLGLYLRYRIFEGDITGATPINGRLATWKLQADQTTVLLRFIQNFGSFNVDVRGGVSFMSFDSEARDQSRKNIQRVSNLTPYVHIVLGVPITLR